MNQVKLVKYTGGEYLGIVNLQFRTVKEMDEFILNQLSFYPAGNTIDKNYFVIVFDDGLEYKESYDYHSDEETGFCEQFAYTKKLHEEKSQRVTWSPFFEEDYKFYMNYEVN